MKHIVCYSGGHSSALVAIEVVRRFGKEKVILLNHNINDKKEDKDVKRFKAEVAEYLGLSITYQNYGNILDDSKIPNQFDVCIKAGAFKNPRTGNALCTAFLKTMPFESWLNWNFPRGGSLFINHEDCCIYYGFDPKEKSRIVRRAGILGGKGYKTDYPLAFWKERSIQSTNDIGITPPNNTPTTSMLIARVASKEVFSIGM